MSATEPLERPSVTGLELYRIALTLGAVDADLVQNAADELIRLRSELKALRHACPHTHATPIITEVGLARQCDVCGFQDFK
jgi:hypothetical protein